jgi:hypothetical protein
MIVLSILDALTSGPLVIQRQVKALRRLGPSSPPDLYADQIIPVAILMYMMGFWMVFISILQGIFSPLEVLDPEYIVKAHLLVLPIIVHVCFLPTIVTIMYRYISHVIRSLRAT